MPLAKTKPWRAPTIRWRTSRAVALAVAAADGKALVDDKCGKGGRSAQPRAVNRHEAGVDNAPHLAVISRRTILRSAQHFGAASQARTFAGPPACVPY